MEFVKDNLVYSTPIYTEINGVQVELTNSQLLSLGYVPKEDYIAAQDEALNDSTTFNILDVFVKSIGLELPSTAVVTGNYVSIPNELGYTYEEDYVDGKVVANKVAVENYVGSMEKPILFDKGVKLVNSAIYVYEGELYKYTGENGTAEEWEDVADFMDDPSASSSTLDIVLKYLVDAPGDKVLYYTGVQPKAAAGPYSTFPEGAYAEIYAEDGTLETTLDLYQPKASEGTVNYEFLSSGEYTVKIYGASNNANGRPQTGSSYDDTGMSVYPNAFRCSNWGVIDGTKTCLSEIVQLNLPAETTNIGQMFNSCKATGKCPDLNLSSVMRATGLFNASKFSEIGDVILPNANTALTDQGEWSDGHQMFASNSNLTKVGNIYLGNMIYANQMFYGDSNLEEIGTFDCLANVVKCDNIFAGCSKLSSIKVVSLPVASSATVDFSACPLDAESIVYMSTTVNTGSSTVKFSATTKALSEFNSAKAALEAKGYTVA